MRKAAALLVWAMGVSQFEAAGTAAGAALRGCTPFTLAEQGGILVPAMMNGKGPFLLLLDTGATHSSISEDVARIVGAPAVATTTVTTSTGSEVQRVVRLDKFQLGPVSTPGLLPSVVRMTAVDVTGRIQGIVGQDVLAAVAYTIEFDKRRIAWGRDAAGPVTAASVFPLEFVQGRFVVELPQRHSHLRLVPDTGSGSVVLFEPTDREGISISPHQGTAELATLTGRRFVQQAQLHELRIGATTWRNVPTVLVSRPRNDRSDPDGLLPLHRFRRVTFDGPRGLLAVLE